MTGEKTATRIQPTPFRVFSLVSSMAAALATAAAETAISDHLPFRRVVNLQQISFIAAFVQADAALGELDKIVFRLLQLEHIHVGPLVDGAGIEQKLVRRDAELLNRGLVISRTPS